MKRYDLLVDVIPLKVDFLQGQNDNNLDRQIAIEAQDRELAKLLQEQERIRARKARERARQRAALAQQQDMKVSFSATVQHRIVNTFIYIYNKTLEKWPVV